MPGEGNPYAEFGLNPDGTPLTVEKATEKTPDVSPELASRDARIADLEAKIAKIPADFEGLTKKAALIDKFVQSLTGGDDAKQNQTYQQVYDDLKSVVRRQSPAVHKIMELLEQDPQAIDRLNDNIEGMRVDRLRGLNQQAHQIIIDAAKKSGVFRAANDAEFAEMLIPYETTVSAIINANAELQKAFVGGNIEIVRDVFGRVLKPVVASRLREKQARLNRPLPGGPPKGGAAPDATALANVTKPNLKNPRERSAFFKEATGRWLDSLSNKQEE